MKIGRIFRYLFALLFALVGIAVSAATIKICFLYAHEKPVLLVQPEQAINTVTVMMNAICAGDYDGASTCILGGPDLGVDRQATDEVGIMIWDTFLDSMEYSLVGECYATEDGLAQSVSFTCLDLGSVTQRLRERSQGLLEQRVDAAVDTAEIYDENNEYRESFVMAVLYDAAEDALEEDARTVTVEFTVSLIYQDDQWWVVADKTLIDAVTGGLLF